MLISEGALFRFFCSNFPNRSSVYPGESPHVLRNWPLQPFAACLIPWLISCLFVFFSPAVKNSCDSEFLRCEHECYEPDKGRAECRCRDGYTLLSDGQSCAGKTPLSMARLAEGFRQYLLFILVDLGQDNKQKVSVVKFHAVISKMFLHLV